MKSCHVYHRYQRIYPEDDFYEQNKIIEKFLEDFIDFMNISKKEFKIININQNFNDESHVDLYIFYEVY